MFELILYSAFWYIVGAVSTVLFLEALRLRNKIEHIKQERGQA